MSKSTLVTLSCFIIPAFPGGVTKILVTFIKINFPFVYLVNLAKVL